MLYTALVIFNFLSILLSDDKKAWVGYIQEVVTNGLSKLTCKSTNALIKVWEFSNDMNYHI